MKLRLAQANQENDDLDVTPLIDVIFLLVLFFMFTSTFIEEARVFQIELPKADAARLVERSELSVVSVSREGQLAWGDERLDSVETLLAMLENWDESRPVVVRCDARCEYQHFVRVKNALLKAGVVTVFEEVGQ